MTQERIIGIYPGTDKGPLVVCLGGIHGNEPAGVEALVQLIQRLSSKARKNPDFRFRGTLLALRGNLAALQHGVRYLHEDLNRAWKPTRIPLLLQQPRPALHAEEREIAELLHHIQQAIDTYQPDSLFL
ncbi:MAG: succinylglutamate desuccinylase/aspartoacylase family protein, partial [Haliscomenobacter sp.]